MGRWEPNAKERLREAATALYVEQGFERTTVAEIAERAGLTSRTFFRYFADKREVLFGGTGLLRQMMVDAIESAPSDATPMQAVAAALHAPAELMGADRNWARQRQEIIAANADLRERELIKLAGLSAALAQALRRRRVREPAASLAAETGMAAFRVAYETWLNDKRERSLAKVMTSTLEQLATLATLAD